ncbi:MAG: TolC family protein [Bacteroidota bacterium]
MKSSILFGIIMSCLSWSIAQQTLSLEDCITLAKGESPTSKIAALDQQAVLADFQAFEASLRPQVFLNTQLPGFTRSITGILQDDGRTLFKTQNQTFSNMNMSFSQVIPLTGGRVSVFSSLSNFTFIDTTNFSTWQAAPLGIRINQPLFRLNTFKWERQEQRLRKDLAEVSYLQEQENAGIQATQLYFEALIGQVNVRRAETNLVNNDTIFELSKGRFSVGKIAENELLQSELNFMKAQAALSSAKLSLQEAKKRLLTFLDLSGTTDINLLEPGQISVVDIDPDKAVQYAMRNSSLIRRQALQRQQAERRLREAKADNRFSADITASFGLNQTGNSIKEAYNGLEDQETFTLGISVPIIQWGLGKAEVQAASYRQQSLEESIKQEQANFANDVYFQALNISQLRRQLEISARSDTVAQKRYGITKSRYLIGKVSIQDLYIAQQEKDQAQIAYFNNLSAYWLALASLRSNTLFDFEKGIPIGN